ncbi:SpoIIAA-like anti-anti-sigma regulatory factor [Blastococcus colisei]|uniref:Anti-sigma factor antagonist n=1 Tax=Blastococcus colisei TaxID=1564162 RepID=A0A543PD65_9ACTN|nr:STAS domain-containing protein [Blastococcus colisei]TQN42019.1 SpoIIAA-like anti-anti-sigma regulatory factor [Blastococcus colisei]
MTASSIDPPLTDLVSVDVSGSGPVVCVAASGEVDSTSASVLRHELDVLLDGDVRELTVDLGQVTFLDSAGLCVLAAAHRRAVRQDVTMRVLASSRAVIRPLQITGLWDLLKAERVDDDPTVPARQGVA